MSADDDRVADEAALLAEALHRRLRREGAAGDSETAAGSTDHSGAESPSLADLVDAAAATARGGWQFVAAVLTKALEAYGERQSGSAPSGGAAGAAAAGRAPYVRPPRRSVPILDAEADADLEAAPVADIETPVADAGPPAGPHDALA